MADTVAKGIFESEPSSWSQLERRVGKILKQCGYEVVLGKKIQTVRGERAVDVHATAVKNLGLIIVCECKHWSRAVSKHVVDSFMSIVSGSEANAGYIISSKGFQKGAFEAAVNSSLRLVTYGEFEQEMLPAWLNAQTTAIRQNIEAIFEYVDDFDPERCFASSKKNAALYSTVWRRTQILRDAGWADRGEPLHPVYYGTKPGLYVGKDRNINIVDPLTYIREFMIAAAMVRDSYILKNKKAINERNRVWEKLK